MNEIALLTSELLDNARHVEALALIANFDHNPDVYRDGRDGQQFVRVSFIAVDALLEQCETALSRAEAAGT